MYHFYREVKRSLRRITFKVSELLRAEELEDIEDEEVHPFKVITPRHTIKTELTFVMTNDDIDDVMQMALKYSRHFWLKGVEEYRGWPNRNTHEQIARYATLTLHDIDEKSLELNLEKFLNGFQQFIIHGGNVRRDSSGQINIHDISFEDADYILQYAVYGKIEYE